MKRRVIAIINSTYASPVLPGKSEKKIARLTVLEHIVGRLRRVPEIEGICLATSTRDYDNTLCQLGQRIGIDVYRGSAENLIARTLLAAKRMRASVIVKVQGNYPLLDPEMTSQLIWRHVTGGYEYSFNEHSRGVVCGMGCQIINRDALEAFAEKNVRTKSQQAAGVLFLLQNRHLFKTFQYCYEDPRPRYRVSLEQESDMLLLEAIFNAIKIPRIQSVIEFLDKNPLIARSNYIDVGQEVGLEKLWLFPDKAKALQQVAPHAPDTTYPISVELSLTNRCNLNCVYCSDKRLRTRLGGELNMQVLRTLIADLKHGGTQGIVFEGGGEPLLYREFGTAVRIASESGLGCGLITNGTKSISPATLRCFDWIRVSLDASNGQEFKALKGRDLFETVLHNIEHYASHCPTVGVGYVVTSQNISSIEPLVLRLRNMGVSYIQFRPVVDHPELLPADDDISYLKRYESPSFQIMVDAMQQNKVKGNNNLPCKAHSLTTVITADGGVYLCGRLNKYDKFPPMGNLNKTSFRQIWNGKMRVRQADMVLNPEYCRRHCPECRITKFNELLARLQTITTRRFI